MTINSEVRKVGPFIGNGTASVFPFTFKVFQASDLEVVRLNLSTNVETLLTLTSNYTVFLNPDQDSNPGGSVTLVGGALASGYTLTLTSDVPYVQPTDLTNQGGFYPDVINDSLDRATIQIQQLGVDVNRSIKIPVSASDVDVELATPQPNNLIGWDSAGKKVINVDPASIGTVVAYATAYADVFEGDGVTQDFVLSHDPAVLYNLDVSIQGATQEPTRDYTLAGTTISFTTAPPDNTRVLVKYKQGLPISSGDSQDIRYLPPFGGGVATTVEAKLRETVSVKDFGAVGDGVTDDTAAIQTALNTLQPIYVPPGIYKVTSELVFLDGSKLIGAGNWSGVSSVQETVGTTVIKYAGAGGSNSCVIRMSHDAVGTESSTNLQNVSLQNITIDGGLLAEFGVYMVRAWSNNNLDYITVTGTTKHGFYAAKCWNGSPTNWMAYKNIGCGITLGKNIFSWSSATVDESACISFFGYFNGVSYGTGTQTIYQNQFNDVTNTEVEYGVGVFGSRGLSMINAQSANNGGAGIFVSTTLYPVTFHEGYSENNGQSSGSTANWDIWINSTASSWNIKFDGHHLGGTTATRLTGTAPSRNECGVVFERMATITNIKADWNNFALVRCNRNATFTGTATAPASAELSPSGYQFNSADNALNAYKEGTFVPTLKGSTVSGTGWAYSVATASYTLIGRICYVTGRVTLSSVSGDATGAICIGNLPYTIKNANNYNGAFSLTRVQNLTTAVVSITGETKLNDTAITLNKRTAAATSDSNVVLGDLSATTSIDFSGFYVIA